VQSAECRVQRSRGPEVTRPSRDPGPHATRASNNIKMLSTLRFLPSSGHWRLHERVVRDRVCGSVEQRRMVGMYH